MSTRIAMLGLGRMGAALAQTMLAHNYPLTVWNRTAAKTAPLVSLGVEDSRDAALFILWFAAPPLFVGGIILIAAGRVLEELIGIREELRRDE